MYKNILFFAGFIYFAATLGTSAQQIYVDCTDPNVAKIHSIKFTGCETKPCTVKRGENYKLTLEYSLKEAGNAALFKVSHSVNVRVLGIWMFLFKADQSITCTDNCTRQPDVIYIDESPFPATNSTTPPGVYKVQSEVINENDLKLLCAIMEFEIK